MTETKEFKQCPFCGDDLLNRPAGPFSHGMAVGAVTHEPEMHYSEGCLMHGLTVSDNEMKFGWADKWNTRPIEDALLEEVETLKKLAGNPWRSIDFVNRCELVHLWDGESWYFCCEWDEANDVWHYQISDGEYIQVENPTHYMKAVSPYE